MGAREQERAAHRMLGSLRSQQGRVPPAGGGAKDAKDAKDA